MYPEVLRVQSDKGIAEIGHIPSGCGWFLRKASLLPRLAEANGEAQVGAVAVATHLLVAPCLSQKHLATRLRKGF